MTTARGAFDRGWSLAVNTRLRMFCRFLEMGHDCRFNGMPILSSIDPTAKIILGDRVVLTSSSRYTALGVNHPVVLRVSLRHARIEIGSDTGMSGGSISAHHKVTIGKGCLIGANVTISDSEFHPIDSAGRRYLPIPEPQPNDAVEIGDDVFIGAGAFILRGTRIGPHAVIGAGAVVKGDVSEGEIMAGNPARHLRSVNHSPVAP